MLLKSLLKSFMNKLQNVMQLDLASVEKTEEDRKNGLTSFMNNSYHLNLFRLVVYFTVQVLKQM